MFMGTFFNSIDAKNRFIVPSKHRDQLGGRCILTKGFDRCLYIYSMSEWEKQVAKLSNLRESDAKVRKILRHFFGNATECEFDKNGRVTIPAELKEYAGINKELVTMGAMSKIEVWSKDIWEDPDNKVQMDSDEFSETLDSLDF